MTPFPSIGVEWPGGNLFWDVFAGDGETIEQTSPCNASLIQRAQLLSPEELQALFVQQTSLPMTFGEVEAFALRLHTVLKELSEPLRDAMQRETGFIARDCDELLEGSFAFLKEFSEEFSRVQTPQNASISYQAGEQNRTINLVRVPWGTVAIILPQNAFLLVALTAIFNSFITGNRVILRAPLQSARSALLLARALKKADVPHHAVSLVLCKSKEFVTALCESATPTLLHYMGSSAHVSAILRQTFEAGKSAIADGGGNVWTFVDEDQNPEGAARILAEGATRYNGQTCTSINGALIHPVIYRSVRDHLLKKLSALKVGNPLENNVDIGVLFDARQSQGCADQMQQSGGTIVIGGEADGNYLQVSLVEKPNWKSALVREGLFGPALWIAPGTRDDFIACWPNNHYPLCAGVLSGKCSAEEQVWWLSRLPNLARLVFNGDTSIEHIFEPWGGYPGSGANPVSIWHEKYTRVISIDTAFD
jgi:acyl-CoA reductase-like NAD-dependent aldehyde dehydrogenase